jgi:methionine aminopeptidase
MQSILQKVYDTTTAFIKPGMTSMEIANYAKETLEQYIHSHAQDVTIGFVPTVSIDSTVAHSIGVQIVSESSIVKIDMGVYYQDKLYILGDTFVIKPSETDKRIMASLAKIKKHIGKRMRVGHTNDDIRMYIEGECALANTLCVENTISYEHKNGCFRDVDSKYIICNYRKYYDDQDILMHPNDCFDLEKGERYTINLSVYDDEFGNAQTKTSDQVHVGFLNNSRYNLKLKSSREFYSKSLKTYKHGVFRLDGHSTREKVGIRECIDNGLLEPLYIDEMPSKIPVYSKKFTLETS